MARLWIPKLPAFHAGLPLFDGFPYLSVRVVRAMRHVTLQPQAWSTDQLDAMARRQVAANRLPACLVLSPDRALAYEATGGGHGRATAHPPRGGSPPGPRWKVIDTAAEDTGSINAFRLTFTE
jgi:hypothetical protein